MISVFYFISSIKARRQREIIGIIDLVYGERIINVSLCHRGFQKFRDGNCNLEDDHRPGRCVELDERCCTKSHHNYCEISIQPIIDSSVTWENSAMDSSENFLSNRTQRLNVYSCLNNDFS